MTATAVFVIFVKMRMGPQLEEKVRNIDYCSLEKTVEDTNRKHTYEQYDRNLNGQYLFSECKARQRETYAVTHCQDIQLLLSVRRAGASTQREMVCRWKKHSTYANAE
jgi:hypothetical protein